MSELLELVKNKLEAKFSDAILSSEMSYDFPLFVIQKESIKMKILG